MSEQDLKKQLLNSLLVMAWAVEARDPYTGGHLWRVSQLSRQIAIALGFSKRDTARIAIGGFLHDLGKIGIPDTILKKNDRLSVEEFSIVKTHPSVGWKILGGHPLASIAEHAVRLHHERPDGNGYPLGLRGDSIPLHARIVGVCDAFDAMTSTRPYRRGMPIEKALSIIDENLGSQFDAEVGTIFVSLGRRGDFNHIVSHSDEGIPVRTCLACGPVMILRRETRAGDKVHCPVCAAEYNVEEDSAGKKVTTPTGKMVSPEALAITIDDQLIDRFVEANSGGIGTDG